MRLLMIAGALDSQDVALREATPCRKCRPAGSDALRSSRQPLARAGSISQTLHSRSDAAVGPLDAASRSYFPFTPSRPHALTPSRPHALPVGRNSAANTTRIPMASAAGTSQICCQS